jgi:hypothetical protein
MKNLILTVLILSITLIGFAQTETNQQSNSESIRKLEELESPDTLRAKSDTTKIKIGKKEVSIFDVDEETEIRVRTIDRSDVSDDMRHRMSKVRKFKGHWAGFEMGFNNYVNSDFSTSLDPSMDFMELRASKSLNVNINFMQYNLRLAGDKIGIVTGLGLEFNDYRFSNSTSIVRDAGVISEVDLSGLNIEKTKLSTSYLTVPLLLEFQTPQISRNRRVHLSAGLIGGVKLGSHTKVVYRDSGKKNKDKVKDDFYLSPFRYGLSFRAGYRHLNVFANYYLTPLFENNKGPELYPFSIGFSLIGF